MSDTYSADPQEETAPGDASEPGETSEPGEAKQSQQQANYREGNPQRSCGLCGQFDSKDHGCEVVDGDISAFGYCDLYLRQDNPFRTGETEAFEGGVDIAGPPPVAPVAEPSGLLQIGRQGYGGAA